MKLFANIINGFSSLGIFAKKASSYMSIMVLNTSLQTAAVIFPYWFMNKNTIIWQKFNVIEYVIWTIALIKSCQQTIKTYAMIDSYFNWWKSMYLAKFLTIITLVHYINHNNNSVAFYKGCYELIFSATKISFKMSLWAMEFQPTSTIALGTRLSSSISK